MSERGAMIVFIAGLILTMAGVGGVENSLSNDELFGGIFISVLGLLAMYAATLGFRNAKFYQ